MARAAGFLPALGSMVWVARANPAMPEFESRCWSIAEIAEIVEIDRDSSANRAQLLAYYSNY